MEKTFQNQSQQHSSSTKLSQRYRTPFMHIIQALSFGQIASTTSTLNLYRPSQAGEHMALETTLRLHSFGAWWTKLDSTCVLFKYLFTTGTRQPPEIYNRYPRPRDPSLQMRTTRVLSSASLATTLFPLVISGEQPLIMRSNWQESPKTAVIEYTTVLL